MFNRFGEFDSYEEINEAAEGLFNEGDLESLRLMAAENGLEAYVEMYTSGDTDTLCDDAMTAALGKIEVEAATLNLGEIMEDWRSYIEAQIMEDEQFAVQVRRKGKNLDQCIAALLKWSFGHQYPVSADIIHAAGVTAGKVTLGIPGMGTARKIIRKYYMGA